VVSLTNGLSWQSRRKDITLLELRCNGSGNRRSTLQTYAQLINDTHFPDATNHHAWSQGPICISYLQIEFAFALVSAAKVINAPGPKCLKKQKKKRNKSKKRVKG